MRKPKVDPLVPTVFVEWLVDRTHVATPDAEITAEIERRCAVQTDPRWTPKIKRQTIRYALWAHAMNRRAYAAVMRGRY